VKALSEESGRENLAMSIKRWDISFIPMNCQYAGKLLIVYQF
jgi:hypothetical protein